MHVHLYFCSNSASVPRVARMPAERYATEYNMKHNKRGFAIIFNHEHFDVMSLKSRAGTNVDCERLRNTLERLHFDVIVHKDLRFDDIKDHIERGNWLWIYRFYFVSVNLNRITIALVIKESRRENLIKLFPPFFRL